MSPRAIALLGSGEFEPWTDEIDRWLLERATGDGGVLIAPAASAHEGDEVFDNWARMGLEHYARQGTRAEVVPLKTREDAEREDLVAGLETASMIFFSGGNPARLAEMLTGTRFWTGVLEAMSRGMAYAGCSAGVASLGEQAPDSDVEDFENERIWYPGLRMFPKMIFGPHWNMLDTYAPGLTGMFVAWMPPGHRLFALDERTGVVGDGERWTVLGAGKVRLMEDGEWTEHSAAESFEAPSIASGDAASV